MFNYRIFLSVLGAKLFLKRRRGSCWFAISSMFSISASRGIGTAMKKRGKTLVIIELLDIKSLPSMKLQSWCKARTKRGQFFRQIPRSLFDLVDKCLTVNPRQRISAKEALQHEFFAPCHEYMMTLLNSQRYVVNESKNKMQFAAYRKRRDLIEKQGRRIELFYCRAQDKLCFVQQQQSLFPLSGVGYMNPRTSLRSILCHVLF
ncbi:uncharacterized protein LOC126585720 isoform X2 [Malus sylvestris]|uniref:uncharacterized protein LOC126585720 isoform X2 n=1 Tax=Malus sylvestris TaxID=3752 RepID=UPI0021ACA7A5|nr:uncharacterized protein LOC126585720 isoform X2 [Malus sylvestris]